MKKVFFSLMCVSAMFLTLVSCDKNEKPDPATPTEKKALATPSIQISEQTENSFTVTWGEVANAASYKVSFNGTDSDVAETSKKFEGLEAGEYTVKVKAVAATDSKEYKDSEWAETKVTIENGGTTPTDNPWVGTWTLSGDKAVVADIVEQDGQKYIDFKKEDKSVSIDITITETELQDENGEKIPGLMLSGLSVILGSDAPAFAIFDEYTMDIMSGMVIGEADGDGYYPMWLAICDSDKGLQYVIGPGITFSLNDENTANGIMGTGTLQDGTAIEVLLLEVVAANETTGSISFYGDKYPYEYPTGKLTLTKKSSSVAETPAAAPVLLPAVKGPVSFAR